MKTRQQLSEAAKKAWRSRRGGSSGLIERRTAASKGGASASKAHMGRRRKAGASNLGKVGQSHLTAAQAASKSKRQGTPEQRAKRIGGKIRARFATQVRSAREGKPSIGAARAKAQSKRRQGMLRRAMSAMRR